MSKPAFGVYRVMADGSHRYVPRTVTHSEKLAKEIAAELTDGLVTMPDGSTRAVKARPHVAKRLP